MLQNKFSLKRFLLILLLLLSAVTLMGLSRQENNHKVQITGRVRLVGSALFAELVISNDEREWYVDKKEQKKLWDLQQQIVTVEGEESSMELTFANGTSAGTRYSLKNIKILKKPSGRNP
jgi:hypothetical protein